MDPFPKSGFYYANKIAYVTLEALEDIMGQNGLNAVLNLAHLSNLITSPPPDNLAQEFDFADFTAINVALEEMYGPNGGHGLAQRVGRVAFKNALKTFGAFAGVGNLAFKILPLQTKLKIGMPVMAKIFSQISDQRSTVMDIGEAYIYTIHCCPQCWGRSGLTEPVCFMGAGLLHEGLKWVSGGSDFKVDETKCMAMGDNVCEYKIYKSPINYESR